MKILITAGSGFIGSHLTDRLIAAGHEVTIFDIVNPKYPSNAKYIKGDILDLEVLLEATQDIDYIFHLAAEANVDRMVKYPIFSTQINVIGTLNVLEAARRNKCQRIFFASTSWIYAGAESASVNEKTLLFPPFPDHLYVVGKMASEMFLVNYQKLYGLDYTIMRFDVVFGPRAQAETVTNIFLRQALNGLPIVIHGSGNQFRQFIYIDDLIEGCLACLKSEARNEVFNFSGAEKISILKIAETIKKLWPEHNVTITFKPSREGDYPGKEIDTSKAQKLLGWAPRYSYEEAMRKHMAWFKQQNLAVKASSRD